METFPLTARLEAPCFFLASTPPGIPGLLHPEERGSPGLGGEGGFLTPGSPAAAPVALARVDVTLLGRPGEQEPGLSQPLVAAGWELWGLGGGQGWRFWGRFGEPRPGRPRPCPAFRPQPLPCPRQELIAALGTPEASSFPTSISRRQNRRKMGARAAAASGAVTAA